MRLSLVLLLIIASFTAAGCSVYMATKQPEKKDLSVLKKGTDRVEVLVELGQPMLTEKREGKTVDVFVFVQGYSEGNKTGRAIAHGVADVLTLGIWEVFGTPIEGAADGTDVKVQVLYDENEKVDTCKVIAGEKVFEKKDKNSQDQVAHQDS